MNRRIGIVFHAPDGDMGDALILGAFQTWDRAEAKRDRVVAQAEKQGSYVEGIVVSLVPGNTGNQRIIDEVLGARS